LFRFNSENLGDVISRDAVKQSKLNPDIIRP